MTQDAQTNPAPSIRILKIGSCPSLSGKSNLTYLIGSDVEGAIHFRIQANTSSGCFSRLWVGLDKIRSAIGDSASITSFTLQKAYPGSQNNGSFLMATWLAEGLVQASSTVDRHFEVTDGKAFFDQVRQLIDSGISLDPDAKPPKPSKKKPASEPALPA